jgi:hypothetical protein
MDQSFREKLVAALPREEHKLLFYSKGELPPESNYSSISETFAKFRDEFLPQCPVVDPRGERVKIFRNNFPKFLNLEVRTGFDPKKPSTIVKMIEDGTFKEEEYTWARDRKEALLWVPGIIKNPDAIYRKKPNHGLIKASEVYVKVYERLGSKVKLVFIDRVGKHNDAIFITSFLTDAHTAVKYCDGAPVWSKK